MAFMANETYGRGQVEWALWCSFARERVTGGDVPQVFRTRIKRLLEIDRDLDLSDAEVPPEADYAFAPPALGASGDVAYSAIDAFCLSIALDLLDAGFKQSEVAFLMRYLRPDLAEHFPGLLDQPSLLSRRRYPAENYPDLPSFEANGRHYADRRLFVILQRVELKEVVPALTHPLPHPVFLRPVFCAGVTALGTTLDDLLPNRRRSVMVVEIAATAQAIQSYLRSAPVIRRGRPKG